MKRTEASSTVSNGSCLPSRSASTFTDDYTDSTQKASQTPSIMTSTNLSTCQNCPTPVSSASTIHPHDSASNYDPAVARLNLPKNVLAQLEQLVAKKPKSITSLEDPDAPTHGMRIRFFTSLLVLSSIGIFGLVVNSYGAGGLSGLLIGCLSIFAFNWFMIYGSGLSRHKRIYFNEKNVLDTYKVYDHEFGHLFQKEPDTPGNCCEPNPNDQYINPSNPVEDVANDLLAKFKAPPTQKAEFNPAVQGHYGNMYDNIRRINQEMDDMVKAKQANAEADKSNGAPKLSNDLTASTNGPFIPADIPLPGKKSDKNNNFESKNN